MKVLFVSSRDVHAISNGGELCTNRNYLSIVEIVGKENVIVFNLMEGRRGLLYPLIKRLNYFLGHFEGVTKNKLKLLLFKSKKCDIIFIDTSVYGIIAAYLKKNGYNGKIICFFHNVESIIRWQRVKKEPKRFAELILAIINEIKAIKYADEIVLLNKRDKLQLKKRYGFEKGVVIPISLQDRLKDRIPQGSTSNPLTFLFNGNNWYANIHGLKWFIENVLDHVEIKLQITGSGMKSIKKDFDHPKVEFLGFVENLDDLLLKADFLLSPIFKGSGMKVKICEALMFGKNIIATSEAFEGYSVDYEKVGALCNTRDEFIDAIKKVSFEKRDKFNKYSRNLFLKKYSFEATLEKFRLLLS